MITIFNQSMINDSLLVILAPHHGQKVQGTRIGNVTKLETTDHQVVGYHFFNVLSIIPRLAEESGQVFLKADEIDKLNTLLFDVNYEPLLESKDQVSKIVVGHVLECEEHPDSDHLHITKTDIGNEVLQIVCGAPNVAAGQKVVVATPGAMMPDGTLIWPGKLRGVDSYGMLCSAKELGLESNGKKGILVLDEDAKVGSVFAG